MGQAPGRSIGKRCVGGKLEEFLFKAGKSPTTIEFSPTRVKRSASPMGRGTPGGFVTHDARHTAVTRMLKAGRDLATIGSITGHADKTLILHYGHASTESRDKAMDVLESFAGSETLGLGLDSIGTNALIYEGSRRSLVPEVGLEPT